MSVKLIALGILFSALCIIHLRKRSHRKRQLELFRARSQCRLGLDTEWIDG